MKRFIAILLLCMIFVSGCAPQGGTYAVSKELMDLLWNVNYQTFTSGQTTEFAEKHYQSEFLQDYLADPEYNSGVDSVNEQKLQSRVLETQDLGTQEEAEGIVQKIRVKLYIDHFKPEDPDGNYFEADKEFTLVYEVYFVKEDGEYKISSFGFEPEGEELLPKSEKQRLTSEQKEALKGISLKYLRARYDIDYKSFDTPGVWAFYQQYCDKKFLDRDEITQSWLQDFKKELTGYHAVIRLKEAQVTVGDQKKYLSEEDLTGFYYYADMMYNYNIDADPAYFTDTGLEEAQLINERIYFDKSEDSYKIVYAEYLD